MDTSLPAALLHLREAEIVRLCGLARAALGQEAARVGKVQQPEQFGGTLRATLLENAASGHVLARFSDAGLDLWECAFHPQTAPPPCEHVAALLSLWVRHREQFRALNTPPVNAPPVNVNAPPVNVPLLSMPPLEIAASPVSDSPASRHTAQKTDTLPDEPVSPARSQPEPPEQARFADRMEHLAPVERRFLEVLALAGGSMTESEVSRTFARLGLGTPEELTPLLGRLRESGWVQPLYAGQRVMTRRIPAQPVGWRMPDETQALFPRRLPLQPLRDSAQEAALSEADALPPETGLHAQPAFSALPALLFGVIAQMANRAAADTGPAAFQPLEAAPEQLHFYGLLARFLGLGDAAVGKTPALLSHQQAGDLLLRAYRLLVGRDALDVLTDVALHWLHAHSAHELRDLRDAGVRVTTVHQREGRRAPDIAAENRAAREQAVDLLRRVPAGRWWSFSSLVEFVYAYRPDFLRGRQQAFLRPQWWLERLEDGRALSLEVRADWRQAEGRYLALLFRRALHWLGLVDLALDERGRLKGFRLTPAGAVVLKALGGAEQAAAPAQDVAAPLAAASSASSASYCWRVLDAGRLLVPLEGLDEQTLALLLAWCEPGGAGADGLVFCPTAERLAAALDAGHDLAAWLAWLERGEPGEALSALLAQSRRWAGMYGRVSLYESAALLETAGAALMRELEAAVALSSQYLDHALAPDLAVVRAGALEPLLEALRKRGYAPWMTNDEITD